MKSSNFQVFHRYWMPFHSLNAPKRQVYGNMTFLSENGGSGSTIHKCRLVPDDPDQDTGNFYVMKVFSYMRDPPKDKKRGDYSPVSPYTKTFQQIQTEYLVLQILNKCHRIAKLKEIIHQNPKRQDDKDFFYNFLKKPKAKGQRYICFVTEFCNEGTLDSKVENNNGGLPKEEVILYAAQILEGLFELKKKMIIHRDLRLCNILLHNGEVRFSDFDTAFIGGKSTWRDVKNGIDIETTPPEIIELASKPDEELMKYDPDELYQRQEKSDNYFFGLALFKMIYGYNYQKFNKSTLQNMISEMILNSDHSPKLLEIMAGCLEERADKRMDFFTLYTEFTQIEKNYYFERRSIDRVYLSQEPLLFASQKSHNRDVETLVQMNDCMVYINSLQDKRHLIDFSAELERTANNRLTSLYYDRFPEDTMHEYWNAAQRDKLKQRDFNDMMESFIRTFSIRSFYYECLYKATLSIDMTSIGSKANKIIVRQSKKMLEQELTIVLAFLFKLLFRAPFKRDRLYNSQNLTYQARRLFNNMIKSDIIQNKMHCYNGKSRQFDYQSSAVASRIAAFNDIEYDDDKCFKGIYQHVMVLLDDIEMMVNRLLKDTVIRLRQAYDKMTGDSNSIKEILFILISLQQQSLKELRKNDIIMIWQCLTPLLTEEAELDKEEVDMFLEEYKNLYAEDENDAAREQNILTVTMYAISDNSPGNNDTSSGQISLQKSRRSKMKIEVSDLEPNHITPERVFDQEEEIVDQ